MPKTKKCQFKSKHYPNYKCPEHALEDSENGYCIFHEPKADKDTGKFDEEIKRKVDKMNYDFTGYWFPGDTRLPLTFQKTARFTEATFKGKADFSAATFTNWAILVDATFEDEAKFDMTTFGQLADFSNATFNAWASFIHATFKGRGDFVGTNFKDRATFGGTIFEDLALLDGVKISVPKHADVLFRKAKTAWHREGNYIEEGKCHYQEMDYIRKQKRWDIRYIWANLFHRCLHGYGEKPHRVILWATVIITACALLFMNFGIGETRLFGVEQLPTYNILKILLRPYNLSLIDLANIGRYFYFSVVTFTTLGYGDLRPVHPISHLISSIEAFTGMFMMALFVLTFGRKWRR